MSRPRTEDGHKACHECYWRYDEKREAVIRVLSHHHPGYEQWLCRRHLIIWYSRLGKPPHPRSRDAPTKH